MSKTAATPFAGAALKIIWFMWRGLTKRLLGILKPAQMKKEKRRQSRRVTSITSKTGRHSMALDNIFYSDPEKVVEVSQLVGIKHKQGCAACVRRDLSALVFGRAACGIRGNYPGKLGFCNQWQFDEGLKHGEN